jgi:NADH-quinone oxidoreductase subunit M
MLEQRASVRGLDDFGGLVGVAPRFAVLFVIASLASVGLPGTVNFIGEFLLLLAAFTTWGVWVAAIAGLSVILGAVYTLRAVQRWLYGVRPAHLDKLADLSTGEVLAVAPLLLIALVLGFYPHPIIARAEPAMKAACTPLQQAMSPAPTVSATTTAPAAAAAAATR